MSGYRSEKANEQRSDDGRSEGDSACKSGTPSHTVKGRVPMTDALIGRACSTDADLRRRALLLFALSSRSLSSYPLLARARIHPAAATWAPRPAQPPRAPALPVLRCDLEFPSDSPRRASRPSERTAAHTRPSASQAHSWPEVLHMQEDRVCAPHGRELDPDRYIPLEPTPDSQASGCTPDSTRVEFLGPTPLSAAGPGLHC
jgi:hypothetical protein